MIMTNYAMAYYSDKLTVKMIKMEVFEIYGGYSIPSKMPSLMSTGQVLSAYRRYLQNYE